MSNTDLVRYTRDGDQFHYLWAARRCLQLLSPASDLMAITIEGPSQMEDSNGSCITAGEEIIDVGEYYGSSWLQHASRIRYVQLKHTTVRTSEAWTMSGLAGTLKGFANRFMAISNKLGTATKVEFVFATNRIISQDVLEAIEDAARTQRPRNKQAFEGLEKYTGLSHQDLASFCTLFRLESEHEGFLVQRSALATDMRVYLADTDQEALLRLKDLVTRKATSEYSSNPTITKLDVLRVLDVAPEELFPAVNKIEIPNDIVPREQERELCLAIAEAIGQPVIVHADGGVGKSVFAMRINNHLPAGSVTVVYDCFGNGEYRAPSHPRHGVNQALVQVVNELASLMYCPPLIPAARVEDNRYYRAFLSRLQHAVASIRQENADALLCIAFDAADNAEMAASDARELTSFASKLLRETLPEGVRLVMLCRTHRRKLLSAPPGTLELALKPFNRVETATKLRSSFPDASEQDVDEFHRLSSCNPRVQSTALSAASSLTEMLRNLGPEPKTVDDMIARLLDQAMSRAKYDVPGALLPVFERICTALALLRPMIPLDVIASIANTDAENVRSFLSDLGQAILTKGALVQFRDEPTEDWFQRTYKPQAQELNEFIDVLRPQARVNTYVAAALPHLLLDAGRIDELITMALTSSDLPEADTLGRRDIVTQRLHFALRASLKEKRYLDATKLALKAAGEAATEDRQRQTLQGNTDLAGRFLDPTQIQDLVTRRMFSSNWRGSHHVYDACLLSGNSDFHAEAQSHLRMGHEWLRNLVSLPPDQRDHERIEAEDIAELVLAHLNVHGAVRAATMVANCRSSSFRFDVSVLVARRLVDAYRLEDIDALAVAGSIDTVLILALTHETARVDHAIPKDVVSRAWRVVRRLPAQDQDWNFNLDGRGVAALTALAWATHKHHADSQQNISASISRHLGVKRLKSITSRHAGNRPELVKAYVFSITLSGRDASLDDLAHPDLKKELNKVGGYVDNGDSQEFRFRVGALLPWYQLWADLAVNGPADIEIVRRLDDVQMASDAARRTMYSEANLISNEVALAHAEIMMAIGSSSEMNIESLRKRLTQIDLHVGTLSRISWILARSTYLKDLSIEFSSAAAKRLDAERMEASEKADSWLALARAVLICHHNESKHYFHRALDVASKIGDENLPRWGAIIHLANAAADQSSYSPKRAYRLARAAELTYEFVYRDKHFDWDSTVKSIADICPTSALAILSRWRDRNFGNCQRLIALLIEHLSAKGLITGELTAAFFGFRAEWSIETLFTLVLTNTVGGMKRQILADFLFSYMRLDAHGVKTWQTVKTVAEQFQVRLDGIDDVVSHAQQIEAVQQKVQADKQTPSPPICKTKDLTPVFADLQVHLVANLCEARERFRVAKEHDGSAEFFVAASSRVTLGRETDFLAALGALPSFELYELRTLLTSLPQSWQSQYSTRVELSQLICLLVARHCLKISIHRYYQALPLDLIVQVTGMSQSEIVSLALDATADVTNPLTADSLFNIVGLLATKLNSSEAKEALDFELTHLESSMSDKDSDGPWCESLGPPADMSTAISGYIWAALAAPESSYRWEAAHVVRALCRLECVECIGVLISWLQKPFPESFVDRSLVHYELHARQWLLIGFSRGVLDRPNVLEPHFHMLAEVALNGNSHVLIRGFASKTALSIAKSCRIFVNAAVLDQLRMINEPRLDMNGPSRRVRLHRQHEFVGPRREPRLHFGIDMPQYWFDRLGSPFGISTTGTCARVEKVILEQWGVTKVRWNDDQRSRHRYIDPEDTSHSHGSYPKADDLRFYLSYHAMMVVAGELLVEIPLLPAEDEWDTFQYWLGDHSLTRPDDRWLSDRRDPDPREIRDWSAISEHNDWPWSISRNDFDRALLPAANTVIAAGHWVTCEEPRREEVSISSALVSVDSARALLYTRQTSSDFQREQSLPYVGWSQESEVPGFELKGWVINRDRRDSLDRFDPWTGDIHFPPLNPAAFACTLLKLDADDEQRHWRQQGHSSVELNSRVWGNTPTHRRDDREVNHGRRLEASRNILQQLLERSGMSLVFAVSIRRRISTTYLRSDEDCVKYPAAYIRYYLLEKDGKFASL